MKYAKPPLSLEQQADLLLSRGMTGDRQLIIERLSMVNYYRLSGYWHTFRNLPAQDFTPNTTFEKIWMRYTFDRQLRLLVMDAVERVEVAFRGNLAYRIAHKYGNPFAYAEDAIALPNLRADERNRFLASLADETKSSKETFVRHFRDKYGKDQVYMPIWMVTEIMTFGHALTLYRGSADATKAAVAAPFGVHDKVFLSWLLTLNTIRNICAHHARLWNRSLGIKPMIPVAKNDPRWHEPVAIGNDRIFGILTVLKNCLDRIAPQSRWPMRLIGLLRDCPEIPLKSMGFPIGWEMCPIWASEFPGQQRAI